MRKKSSYVKKYGDSKIHSLLQQNSNKAMQIAKLKKKLKK